MTYLGLYALQHRGQESAGIAASDGEQVRVSRAMGYVADAFDGDDARHACRADRRSATCATRPPARASCSNAQPILIDCAHGQIAHLPQRQPRQRAASCATSSCAQGSIFQSNSDTEVILHLYARSKARDASRTRSSSRSRRCRARSRFVHAHEGPADRRPRSARLPSARARTARRRVGRLLRDVRDGPDRRDLRARRRAGRNPRHQRRRACGRSSRFAPAPLAHCVFEHVYFARPDSYVFGKSVNEVRTELGRMLAREQPVDADVVVPVPDSGVCAAMGYRRGVGHSAAHGAHPQSLRRPHVHPAAVSRSATSASR